MLGVIKSRSFLLALLSFSLFFLTAQKADARIPSQMRQIIKEMNLENRCGQIVSSLAKNPHKNTTPFLSTLSHLGVISSIYRPSSLETRVIDYLARLADAYGLEWKKDARGNILIYRKGTGKFSELSRPVAALQAHADMILKVKNLQPEYYSDFFKNGVFFEREDDIIRARDGESTAGFDDGIGVAMIARFITHPPKDCPPLELIVTVDEEAEFTGVLEFDLPVESTRMISLDGESDTKVFIGASGASKVYAGSDDLPSVNIDPSYERYEIKFDGFLGGHSALKIHLNRANAMIEVARWLQSLEREKIPFLIESLEAGEMKNTIPTSFKLVVYAPKNILLEKNFRDFIESVGNQYSGIEDPNRFRIDFSEKKLLPSSSRAIALDPIIAERLVKMIVQMPNGLLERKEGYENEMFVSSNQGVLKLNTADGKISFHYEAMPRSHSEVKLDQLKQEMVARIKNSRIPFSSIQGLDASNPWRASLNSLLVRLWTISMENPKIEFVSAAGAIELSVFAKRFPQIKEGVCIGPEMYESIHAPGEKMSLSSTQICVLGLEETLIGLGEYDLVSLSR